VEDVLGSRVAVGLAEMVVDGKALWCAAETAGLESLTKYSVIERNGKRQAVEFLRAGLIRRILVLQIRSHNYLLEDYFRIVRTLDISVN
jgi:hypothetical protein